MNIQLDQYIEIICDLLDIEQPTISYDTSLFPTPTTKAMCNSKGTVIYLKDEKPSLDLMYAIAHELRHAYQAAHNPNIMEGYISSDKLNTDAYNLQPAELDANAFATYIMGSAFGVAPRFHENFPQDAQEDMKRRVKAMCSKYDPILELIIGE